MRNVPAGNAVTLSIPFKNASGVAVTPTGIVVTVLDADGRIVHGPEIPVHALEHDTLSYRVTPEANTLPVGDTISTRTVEVELSTADGLILIEETYLVRTSLSVVYLKNSFQTYNRALVTATEMPRLDAWNDATLDERTPALLEAYRRLVRFGYRIAPDGEDDCDQDRIAWPSDHVSPREWPVMDPARYEDLPASFRAALNRAQVQEANAILTTGTADESRSSGLVSKKTGESEAAFRPSKPLDLGVAKETLAHLAGYVEIRARISRS